MRRAAAIVKEATPPHRHILCTGPRGRRYIYIWRKRQQAASAPQPGSGCVRRTTVVGAITAPPPHYLFLVAPYEDHGWCAWFTSGKENHHHKFRCWLIGCFVLLPGYALVLPPPRTS